MPSKGGLDPETGVNIDYITEGDYVKYMLPLPGANPYWLGSLINVKDSKGNERLVANYVKIKGPLTPIARGIAEYNDKKQVFEVIKNVSMDAIIRPSGHPFRFTVDDVEYAYFFGNGVTRCPTTHESIIDHTSYEAFTCLKEGSKFDGSDEQLDKADDGLLRYSWKRNTSPIKPRDLKKLLRAGHISREEVWFQLIDIETGNEITTQNGSVYWNPYRKRWIMIISEVFGSSMLGEIWYAEGDTPLGPWVYATKIVTHDMYSFYNPVQHPHFAKDEGRSIFFEGTYTQAFSGAEHFTPRYDYNQIMYKLELNDPRLFLPVPVYRVDGEKGERYASRKIPESKESAEIAFFAPDRQRKGTIPVYRVVENSKNRLVTKIPESVSEKKLDIAFYALPPDTESSDPILPLYEFSSEKGDYIYSTEEETKGGSYTKSPDPLCIVWKNPCRYHILD
jgi:hypothetical protein